MKRIIFIFGIILGVILCINLVYVLHLMYTKPDFEGNMLVGYAIMVVIFSLTFFGILNYRNNQLNGQITFGKAFKTGALIAFTGATVYVIFWLFYYNVFAPDFIDVYIPHALKNVPPEELEAKTKQMQDFKEMYKNPLFVIVITYAEVLPVGLVVALVSALILKRKMRRWCWIM